jgi:spermidine/putrescine transport system substrate-binding protein
MKNEDMLEKIDKSKLKNLATSTPSSCRRPPTIPRWNTAALLLRAAGIAVNKSKVAGYDKSWSIFERKDLAAR